MFLNFRRRKSSHSSAIFERRPWMRIFNILLYSSINYSYPFIYSIARWYFDSRFLVLDLPSEYPRKVKITVDHRIEPFKLMVSFQGIYPLIQCCTYALGKETKFSVLMKKARNFDWRFQKPKKGFSQHKNLQNTPSFFWKTTCSNRSRRQWRKQCQIFSKMHSAENLRSNVASL